MEHINTLCGQNAEFVEAGGAYRNHCILEVLCSQSRSRGFTQLILQLKRNVRSIHARCVRLCSLLTPPVLHSLSTLSSCHSRPIPHLLERCFTISVCFCSCDNRLFAMAAFRRRLCTDIAYVYLRTLTVAQPVEWHE
jgi:hypothetical protein